MRVRDVLQALGSALYAVVMVAGVDRIFGRIAAVLTAVSLAVVGAIAFVFGYGAW